MQPWRQIAATTAAAILLPVAGLAIPVAGLAIPAAAQTTPPTAPPSTGPGIVGWNNSTPTGIGTGVSAPGGTATPVSSGAPSSGNAGGATPCQWTFVGSQSGGNGIDPQGNVLPGAAGGQSGTNGTPVANAATGSWYLETCPGQAPVSIFIPTGTGGPPAAPPPPPAPAEAAQLAPFPAESIRHDPCYLGLTGLTSWLWATVNGGPVPAVSAAATIRGYAVTVTAHPVAYHWGFGNGGTATSYQSGTQANPSVSYMYDTSGTYDLTLIVTWAGTYTFTGHGIAQTQPVGPVQQTTQHYTWPVQQIRSVLIAPGSATPATAPDFPRGC